MTKMDKIYCTILCVMCLIIGFFCGGIVDHDRIQRLDGEISDFEDEIKLKNDTIEFWRDGYMRRDSALYKISDHKDCTFDLKSIIGDIN